jgi:L,D-transpeptidase ErfK/SrfK
MLSRIPAFARCLSLAALCAVGPVSALEFPLPPPGEDIIGSVQTITAKYEDTFADLATQYDLGYLEMIAANPGIDAWLPGAGTQVILPTRFILPPGPREGIVINLAEYRLYYYPKGRNVVYTFPLGIGREGWGSPVSTTKVTAKTPNPTWTPPASVKAEHHGCFRMYNNNVLEMADMVPVGTTVRIMNEPYKFGVSGGKVFLEAHTPLDESGNPSVVDKHTAVINALLKREDLANNLRINWDEVRDVVAAEDGMPVEIAVPGAAAPIINNAPVTLQ